MQTDTRSPSPASAQSAQGAASAVAKDADQGNSVNPLYSFINEQGQEVPLNNGAAQPDSARAS
jgi:hypothetical protein